MTVVIVTVVTVAVVTVVVVISFSKNNLTPQQSMTCSLSNFLQLLRCFSKIPDLLLKQNDAKMPTHVCMYVCMYVCTLKRKTFFWPKGKKDLEQSPNFPLQELEEGPCSGNKLKIFFKARLLLYAKRNITLIFQMHRPTVCE